MGAGGNEESREALCTASGNGNGVVAVENKTEASQGIGTQLPYTPAILLWGAYPNQSVWWKELAHMILYSSSIFRTVQRWRQPKYE